MATWAYPPLAPEQLKREEDSALVRLPSEQADPALASGLVVLTKLVLGQRAPVAFIIAARVSSVPERGPARVQGTFGSEGTGFDPRALVAAVRKPQRLRNPGRD